jgi:hypothetical protein
VKLARRHKMCNLLSSRSSRDGVSPSRKRESRRSPSPSWTQ